MRKASKVLFVLGILSFIVIFTLKMDNNNEMQQYYSEKEQKAKQEFALLQEANSQLEEGFEITQERIDVIIKAENQLDKINEFSEWCNNNFEGTNVEECYYVFEDYLNSVDHLIPEIDRIMN